MRRTFQCLVPSMFHRRLILLAAAMGVVVVLLGIRLADLTIAQGAMRRERAESVLLRTRLIPTARGRILDRKGRVLAMDRASYDVCVTYRVLTGAWAYQQARRAAYRANRARWSQLHTSEREELTARHAPKYEQQVQGLWEDLAAMGKLSSEELAERRAEIQRRVMLVASDVWARRLQARSKEEENQIAFADIAQPISEQNDEHAILIDITPRIRIAVGKQAMRSHDDPEALVWREVGIRPSRQRAYPLERMTVSVDRTTLPSPLRSEHPLEVEVDGVGTHILGTMRGVWKEDADRRPYRVRDALGEMRIDLGGYLPGDRVGNWGMERAREDELRGLRGQVIRHLDTQTEQRKEPRPGRDITLTLDTVLQARVQAAMDPRLGLMRVQPWHRRKPPEDPLVPKIGDVLNGVAVVLDVSTGQVLAAVSTPAFSLTRVKQDPASVWGDHVNRPWLNRVFAQPYQPGSTIKPLVLAAAVADGKLGAGHFGDQIVCEGHLDPEAPNRYRCWIYKMFNSTHGPLGGAEAIARSCNIFFYTLGRRLGPRRLAWWYDALNLGRPMGAGLIEEAGGDLPDLAAAGTPGAPGFTTSDGIFMAIGQGPVRWTALQAASSYATLARGGLYLPPSLVLSPQSDQDSGQRRVGFTSEGVDLAMRGLEQAVNERYGTAHHLSLLRGEPIFNIEGVRLYGKSGTAQAVPLWVDENKDGKFTPGVDKLVRRGDHAWTICMAQKPGSSRPDYVVVVLAEFGGSGGTLAGPVVNQVLHAMRLEGYL